MAGVVTPLARLRIDPYLLAILGTVGLAVLVPARGAVAVGFGHATDIAIGLLFLLYGARLSPSAVLVGMRNWRLHLTVLASTFVLFPLLGLAGRALVPSVLSEPLYVGLLFLCILPSTVQSSITFTSVARGNVAAAICSASFSNLVGVLLTPLLAALLLRSGGAGFSLSSVSSIVVRLVLPFLAGQVMRRWIGRWVRDNRTLLGLTDRGVILLAVYTAFSAGVVAGVWHRIAVSRLGLLLVVNLVLLAAVLGVVAVAARWLGFPRADRITIVFCGSKKSLASGLPMATVLFNGGSVSMMVLPLMLFHQLQLIACGWLAQRYAGRGRPAEAGLSRVGG